MINWILTSSVLIVVVAALRFLLRGKISLRLQYALWLIVLLRLLCPFEIGATDFSMLNTVEQMPVVQEIDEIQELGVLEYDKRTGTIYEYGEGDAFQHTLLENQPEEAFHRLESAVKLSEVLTAVHAFGTAGFLIAFFWVNYNFTAKLVRNREPLDIDGRKLVVYVTDAAETPCLFGLVEPAIYVTPGIAADETVLRHVLEHETTHYYHKDHIWAVLRCIALSIHWFNPLVWWAARLSKADGELACDEAALNRLGEGERYAYGKTLIEMTKPGREILLGTATTMTGSKSRLRERIEMIAKKPKMAAYTLAAVVLIAVVAAVCTFSGAENHKFEEWLQTVKADGLNEAYISWGAGYNPQSLELGSEDMDELCGILNQIDRTALRQEKYSGNYDSYILNIDWKDESDTSHRCMFKLQDEDSVSVSFDYDIGIEMIEEGKCWYIDSVELVEFIVSYAEGDTTQFFEKVEVVRADVDSDGGTELIFVEQRAADLFQLRVEDSDGTVIWKETAGTAHVGWNTIMLYRNGATEALVRYGPYASTGIATYSVTLFRPVDGVKEVLWEDSVEFNSAAEPNEYPPEVATFLGNVNALMEYCTVLLSTQDGEVVIGPTSTQSIQWANEDLIEAIQDTNSEQADVAEAMRTVGATHFTYTEGLGNLSGQELAEAMNQAAGNQITREEAGKRGYDPDTSGFWGIEAYTQGFIETGITRDHLRFELNWTQAENVVEVTYGRYGSYSTGYFLDETLYKLVRYKGWPRIGEIDQEAFKAFEDILVPQMETRLKVMSESQSSIYGYELVEFHEVYSYEEDDGALVELYDFDYGLLTDAPQNIQFAGGMYLDGYLRLRGINGGGQLAVRYRAGEMAAYAFMGNDFGYVGETISGFDGYEKQQKRRLKLA